MPLFRVAVRTKPAPAEDRPPAVAEARPTARTGRPGVAAVAAGALAGLAVVAGVTGVLLRQNSEPGAAGDALGAQPGADRVQMPSAVDAASWSDTRTGPASINPEFNLEQTIAYVNGNAIAMRDLDRAVRIARVLGALSGDPVPANDALEFRDFQVKMLKRIIDVELMVQGVRRAGLMVPGGDTQTVVDAFLTEVGATREQLQAAMAANGVTSQELDHWFRDSRTANFLVTQQLTVGKETEPRDAVTQAWLTDQWSTQSIVINFYEPEG